MTSLPDKSRNERKYLDWAPWKKLKGCSKSYDAELESYSFTIPKPYGPGGSQRTFHDETFLLRSHSFRKFTRTSGIFSLGQGCWKPTKP